MNSQPGLNHNPCPDCSTDDVANTGATGRVTRREFLNTVGRTVGGVVLASAAARILPAAAQAAAATPVQKPESLVKALFTSLSPRQREALCMPWDSPLRSKVGANWEIVKPAIKDMFTADQQEMVRGILKGVTTEEWYSKILKQFQDDGGGLEQYHVALFGDPSQHKFEWVLTGRHCTMRVDGHSNSNAAFGGPIFYGHAPKFNEDPGHPGNVYWEQGRKANEVFAALDGKQRTQALLDKAPPEDKINLQGPSGQFPGIAIGELSRDQKALVRSTMHDLLSPHRPEDAKEVVQDIEANGGLDSIHLSFYKQEALGHDGIWDIWRLEGPSIVWHFRGAPHVHTWVNVARDARLADGHV